MIVNVRLIGYQEMSLEHVAEQRGWSAEEALIRVIEAGLVTVAQSNREADPVMAVLGNDRPTTREIITQQQEEPPRVNFGAGGQHMYSVVADTCGFVIAEDGYGEEIARTMMMRAGDTLATAYQELARLVARYQDGVRG